MKIRIGIKALLLCAAAILPGSCGEAEHTFCSLPARFHMDNVYQAAPLYTALNSMGEFCTISMEKTGKRYVFCGANGTPAYVNISAQGQYTNNWVCLTGFVVGLPNIPEMGQDQSRVICYELACSNCYNDFNITKPLMLKDAGYAYCKSCKRTYNLNSQGMVSDGEAGRTLYRYRVSHIGSSLVISNR